MKTRKWVVILTNGFYVAKNKKDAFEAYRDMANSIQVVYTRSSQYAR